MALALLRRTSVRPELLLAVLVAAPTLVGCGRQPLPTRREPAAIRGSADVIATGPVGGQIRGRAFATLNARYYVDHRPGYEKLEIVLSAADAPTPCADTSAKRATAVWLRRKGAHAPAEETIRVAPDQKGAWEAHYEDFDGIGWVGSSDAAMLLRIDKVQREGEILGSLSACFGDESQSCVEGTFTATPCVIRVDAPVRGIRAIEPLPDGGAAWAPNDPSQSDAGSDASVLDGGAGDGG